MQIFKTRNELEPYLDKLRKQGRSIGFVPTMGALHAGHLSLIAESSLLSDFTVCSIFVNPTQFNNSTDLEKYPRPVETDIKKLESSACNILYLPEVDDVYPQGTGESQEFNLFGLDLKLEGASRPGHFTGVVQVVKVLLEIVNPDNLYLGQKDYQQFLILKRLVELLDLPVNVIMCPIYREENGLAMSSRNERLPKDLREKAGIIYATLTYAASMINDLKPEEIKLIAIAALNSNDNFKVDYFEILDPINLEPISSDANWRNIIIVVSVIVGGIRLLDNMLIEGEDH